MISIQRLTRRVEHHEDDRSSFYGPASLGIATCQPINIWHLMTVEAAFSTVKAHLMAVEATNMPVEAMDHLEHSRDSTPGGSDYRSSFDHTDDGLKLALWH